LTPWHIRVLCDDPWNGGKGFQLSDVCNMTLDQVAMLLVDRKALQDRKRQMMPLAVESLVDKDGNVRGVSEDGKVMHVPIGTKSLARQLMEAEAAKRALGPPETKKKRRTR
jgi:hypothetical protein